MISTNKAPLFLLSARAPGTFDDPVSFAAVELGHEDVKYLLGLIGRAEGMKRELPSFDEFTVFDGRADFFGSDSDLYGEDAIQDALEAIGFEGSVVRVADEDIEIELSDAISLDVQRVHVEPEAVYWSGLYSDDTRVESARISKALLNRLLEGEDIQANEAIST